MSGIFEKTTAGICNTNIQTQPPQPGPQKYNIGEWVIVRCRDAGVHYGLLVDYYDRTVVIHDSRRMWDWKSGGNETTLSGCARQGIDPSSKIAGTVAGNLVLTESCEIIPCSDACINTFQTQPVAEQE